MDGLRIGLLLVATGQCLAVSTKMTITTNPFAAHPFYLNPVNQELYNSSTASAGDPVVRSNLERMRGIASAYWIDKKDKIRGHSTRSVEGILADAASKSPPELVVLIWYDFPNRDCAAAASAGEICCAYKPDGTCDWGAGGDCAAGVDEYKAGYVDPFVEVLSSFKGRVPVAIVFEPDSLPNFATNMDKPHCGSLETKNAYTKGATYALNQLLTRTDAAVYLDAAHGGWLGWHDNLMKYMSTLKELAVPFEKIRGFATNVAGYQPLGHMCPWKPDDPIKSPHRNGFCLNGRHAGHACCADGCNLLNQWDPAQNELNYAQELHHAAKAELGIEAHIVIDTGRNGVPTARGDCSNWCNIRGAGAGHTSTAETEAAAFVDAYFYLKTPGESDGCTQMLPDGKPCPRFDTGCGSTDAIGHKPEEPRAPEAGGWFDYQVKQLAEFADFGNGVAPVHASAPVPVSVPEPVAVPASAPAAVPEKMPAQAPSHVPASAPAPSSSAQGSCCWGDSCSSTWSCASPSSFCALSKQNCDGSCSGLWCPASSLVSFEDHQTNPQGSARRQGRLRAGRLQPVSDNILLQKFGTLGRLRRKSRMEFRVEDSVEESLNSEL